MWRLKLPKQTDSLSVVVCALRYWLNLIPTWYCLVFSLHNIRLSWSIFGSIYFRTTGLLYMICGGFDWTLWLTWYSWWYLLIIAHPKRFYCYFLRLDISIDSWSWYVFQLPCLILLYHLINFPPHIHKVFFTLWKIMSLTAM